MTRTENINLINQILKKHGDFIIGELNNFDNTPVLNKIGKTHECIDTFEIEGCGTTIYENDIEKDTSFMFYDELTDELLDEVRSICQMWDVQCDKK